MKHPLHLIVNLTASIALMFLLTASHAGAEESGAAPLFSSHTLMKVRVEAPLDTLTRQRPDEEYLDGKFHFVAASGEEQALDLKLRTRGKYRRQKDTCSFPPVRLNFRKKQVEGTEFAGQDKLKLVTHCQTRRKTFDEYVLMEYLAYRIQQTMTDHHFGARLMQIEWINTEDDDDPLLRYGFVIEDDDDIGKRIGMERARIEGITYAELERAELNLSSVFQYLIANTDFSFIRGPAGDDCCHNNVLFVASPGTYIPIPYDFDFSGIVNAPYAEPNPRFKIRSVRTRVYRGRCDNNELLPPTFAQFKEKEPEIRALIDDLPDLRDRTRKRVHKFIDDFYTDITEPKQIERRFIKRCN